MNKEGLESRLDALLSKTTLKVSDEQKTKLICYVKLLHKWNKTYNLTSVRDPEEMLIKHILDSLVVNPYLEGTRFIDVGTGPGLPGIPLAIMNPNFHFSLLDSLGKRIRFIKQALYELKIENVLPIQSRVNEFFPKEKYDGVLCRAFASTKDIVQWCKHLLKEKTGVFFALKGQLQENESSELLNGYFVRDIYPLFVPELEGERHLVVLLHE